MDIKQYDIVKYNGRTQRVMLICNGSMCLTEDDWQSPSSVELVESFKNPDFQIGDEVFIHPIPDTERKSYPSYWLPGMDDCIQTTAKIVGYEDILGTYRLNNDHLFAPYHLEKETNYDIV